MFRLFWRSFRRIKDHQQRSEQPLRHGSLVPCATARRSFVPHRTAHGRLAVFHGSFVRRSTRSIPSQTGHAVGHAVGDAAAAHIFMGFVLMMVTDKGR